MSFMSDVAEQVACFAESQQVGTDRVHIRFFTADGSDFLVHGGLLFNESGETVMIYSSPTRSRKALVVREGHLFKAEFQLPNAPSSAIGFHTEAAR